MMHVWYTILILLSALLVFLSVLRLYNKQIASGVALEALVTMGWSLVRTGGEWTVMAGTQVLAHSPSAQLAITQAAKALIDAQKEAGRG